MRRSGMRFWGALALALAIATPAWRPARAQSAAVQQLLADGDAAYEREDFKKAAQLYDRAISQEPTGVKPEAYAKRATIFVTQRRYQEGLAWLSRTAEKVYPNDARILEQKALLLSMLPERRKEAIELAEQVTQRSPGSYACWFLIGEYYFNAGAKLADQTITAYEAYLRSRPSDLGSKTDKKVKVKLGLALLQKGAFKEAEQRFNEALRTAGDRRYDPNARKGLCAAYAGQQMWDKAITTCENVIKEKAALRNDPSPYYNVSQAYVGRNRWQNALTAANAYIAAKPNDYKGYLLRGQVFHAQGKWAQAEDQLNRADQMSKRNPDVARWLARVYLEQQPPQTKKAIDRFTAALQANPFDPEMNQGLAEAYFLDGQFTNAATTADKALAMAGNEQNIGLLIVAGKAHYEGGDLQTAFSRFSKALEIRKDSGQARSEAVKTLVMQASERFQKEDLAGAEKYLNMALDLDRSSDLANFDMGVLRLVQDKPKDAVEHLSVRAKRTPNDMVTNRLLGKAYLMLGDTGRASEFYGRAETEAKRLRNVAVLAEIYTEWAPLLLAAGKVEEAVDKLESAAQYSAGQPFDKATRRNLQVAYFHRGYQRLRGRNAAGAVSDLEGATREPALLKGQEEDVFTFALGLAYLAAGQEGKASGIFQSFARKGGSVNWLKPPYDKLGIDLFLAYALYREGSPAARQRAQSAFEKLLPRAPGALAGRVRDLLRSSWEFIAYDHFGRGNARAAEAALKKAESYPGGDRRAIDHNLAVLAMDKRGDTGASATFEHMGDRPPEALVNLGILYDRAGDARKAYDAWVAARAKGARAPKLDDWIAAKKRIFNF